MDCDKLFSEVKFFMARCNRHDEIKDILINGGARHINYLSEQVTHVIADSKCPEAEEAIDLYDKPVVTPLWMHLCLKAQRLLPAEAFSPYRRVFHNVVAAFSSDLSKTDIDVLAATLTFYGGQLTKELERATHFIATSTKASELGEGPNAPHKFLIIAPDWIIESVKQNSRLDEALFDPGLLLGPPPPTPPRIPTPPAIVETEDVSKNTSSKDSGNQANRPGTAPDSNGDSERDVNIPIQNQDASHMSQQRFQNHQPQFNPNQQSRIRMVTSVPRGTQQRFRQILPPNSIIPQARQIQPQPRTIMTNSQQPRKLNDYNHAYRKAGPYQPGPEIQPMHQQQPPINTYQQVQHPPMHQQGPHLSQSNRISQPNVYQQARPPYQNNQMPTRMEMSQQNMINQQQTQTQTMNRFQDPPNQMNQPRPYQLGVQHQPVNTAYQQGTPQRQPMYYNQNQNMTMRMPQQGPPPRMVVPNDHMASDNYSQPIETIQPHPQYQQAYQQPPRHQTATQQQQHHQQQQQQQQQQPHQHQQQQLHRLQQFQQPHPPVVMQTRPQFQPNIPGGIRGARSQMANQEVKSNSKHQVEKVPRGPRSASIQTQPHPSIFDPKQESSYAQMKAKVPILTDNIQYYDHSPGFQAPEYQPFSGCIFKMVEHSSIDPKRLKKWTDAIIDAGGRFSDNMDELTHIICESRSTPTYSEAMKKGIRCITIYWINDVLAEDRMTYPWKALHVPTPFVRDDKPLQNQIISISNFKSGERREVKEMIMKTGAKSTDYFSQANTLLICGSPGGEKYDRAIEWSIPIANCQLLSDFLISGRDFSQMLAHAKYQNFNRGDQLKLDSYVLIRDLMQSWTKPMPLPVTDSAHTNGTSKDDPVISANEDSGLATGGSTNSDTEAVKTKLEGPTGSSGGGGDLKVEKIEESNPSATAENAEQKPPVESKDISPNDDLKAPIKDIDVDIKAVDISQDSEGNMQQENCSLDEAPIPGSDISNAEAAHEGSSIKSQAESHEQSTIGTNTEPAKKALRTSNEPVRILFTHLESKLVKQLQAHALKLGLSLAGNHFECTHLVVDQISRTPKFICAFSHAKYILSYQWLVESHRAGQVLDEKAFILQDSEGEKKFSFNLVYSLLKRRRRKGLLFADFIFFVTPAVLAGVKNLKEMIESAGGMVATRKLPTLAQLSQIRTSGKRFLVITNQQDLHLCSDVEQIGVDLLRVEFVISGILRQDIDIEAHRINTRQSMKNSIEASSNSSDVVASPNKKLRFE